MSITEMYPLGATSLEGLNQGQGSEMPPLGATLGATSLGGLGQGSEMSPLNATSLEGLNQGQGSSVLLKMFFLCLIFIKCDFLKNFIHA